MHSAGVAPAVVSWPNLAAAQITARLTANVAE
jgi:hypothetical protein